MMHVKPSDPLGARRPRARGRQRWYILLALALCLTIAGAVTISAATRTRTAPVILAPTDPTIPLQAIDLPESRS